MKIRLVNMATGWSADGAVTDPPEIGKPFSVLMVEHGRLIMTDIVKWISWNEFQVADGTFFVWQPITKRRPVAVA